MHTQHSATYVKLHIIGGASAVTCGGAGDRAHYETAAPGSFHLVPSPERRAQIERDYRGMVDMFMATPPSFETIVAELEGMERQINTA